MIDSSAGAHDPVWQNAGVPTRYTTPLPDASASDSVISWNGHGSVAGADRVDAAGVVERRRVERGRGWPGPGHGDRAGLHHLERGALRRTPVDDEVVDPGLGRRRRGSRSTDPGDTSRRLRRDAITERDCRRCRSPGRRGSPAHPGSVPPPLDARLIGRRTGAGLLDVRRKALRDRVGAGRRSGRTPQGSALRRSADWVRGIGSARREHAGRGDAEQESAA